jgi:hypothetical protein
LIYFWIMFDWPTTIAYLFSTPHDLLQLLIYWLQHFYWHPCKQSGLHCVPAKWPHELFLFVNTHRNWRRVCYKLNERGHLLEAVAEAEVPLQRGGEKTDIASIQSMMIQRTSCQRKLHVGSVNHISTIDSTYRCSYLSYLVIWGQGVAINKKLSKLSNWFSSE